MTAANPAAVCEWCYGPLTGVEPRIAHYRALHERIRALEAENDAIKNMRNDWEAHARRAEARVKELDAMLYEMRSQRDYAVAILEDRER